MICQKLVTGFVNIVDLRRITLKRNNFYSNEKVKKKLTYTQKKKEVVENSECRKEENLLS